MADSIKTRDTASLWSRCKAIAGQPWFMQLKKETDRWAIWVLLLVAILYYSSYYRSGINLSGEGGTTAVIAMRINEGWRPIVDTFLGYNVMWFYPVAWLFELFGPNYIVLRLFFFLLCTVTTLLSFRILYRLTGVTWFSFAVALLPMGIPGMIFRNYMAFLAMANMFCLLETWCLAHRRNHTQAWFAALSGVVLALTYLIRIELGLFVTVMHVGLALVTLTRPQATFVPLLAANASKLSIIAALAFLIHLPFIQHAKDRGFEKEFLAQYPIWIDSISNYFQTEWRKLAKKKSPPPSRPSTPPKETALEAKAASTIAGEPKPATLHRRPLSDAWNHPDIRQRFFTWSLYLPASLSLCMILGGCCLFAAGLWRKDENRHARGLELLTATGCALILFPQYYFFRPDLPHLSEMMVPFFIAIGYSAFLAAGAIYKNRNALLRIILGAFVLLCVFDCFAYIYYSAPKDVSGNSSSRSGRHDELRAANGVNILLSTGEKKELQALCDAITSHSAPGDYLICYPYQPTLNFMTDRPSYLHNLYVDDVTGGTRFNRYAIADIEKHRPKVIAIDNRDINKTEYSRFQNWAAPVYAYIQQNYTYIGTFFRNEVYVRKD